MCRPRLNELHGTIYYGTGEDLNRDQLGVKLSNRARHFVEGVSSVKYREGKNKHKSLSTVEGNRNRLLSQYQREQQTELFMCGLKYFIVCKPLRYKRNKSFHAIWKRTYVRTARTPRCAGPHNTNPFVDYFPITAYAKVFYSLLLG